MKVCLPFYAGDAWLIEKNLDWYAELDGRLDYDCVLCSDDATDHRNAEAKAKQIFRSVQVLKYDRAYHNGILMTKWPWQQNNAFVNTARFMPRFKEPWAWVETDTCPLRAGWLKTLEEEYKRGKKPFGGHWNEKTNVFNGVAIYPPNVGVWAEEALMASLIVGENYYQPPWDYYCSARVKPNLHIMNHVMQHLWNLPDTSSEVSPTFPDTATVQRWIRPGVVLFHRCKDGSLLDRLRELKNKPVVFAGTDVVHPKKPEPPPKPAKPSKPVKKVKMPSTDIFVVSFRRDLEYFEYLMRSIAKFATGFKKVVVAVPTVDEELFSKFPGIQLNTYDEAPGKGMIHHEAIVCMADKYCTADYILHMDSDCIFTEPVTPLDYFVDGKPVLLKERFARLESNCLFWQEAVEKALGFKPEYETMRRHPAVHPRDLYARVRKSVELHTKKPFLDYVLSCRDAFPQGFAEFPTLGAWALKYAPKLHHWVDVEKDPRPKDKLRQFYTHSGVTKYYEEEKKTAREIMEEILA